MKTDMINGEESFVNSIDCKPSIFTSILKIENTLAEIMTNSKADTRPAIIETLMQLAKAGANFRKAYNTTDLKEKLAYMNQCEYCIYMAESFMETLRAIDVINYKHRLELTLETGKLATEIDRFKMSIESKISDEENN